MESEIAYLEEALERYARLRSAVADPRVLRAIEELVQEARPASRS